MRHPQLIMLLALSAAAAPTQAAFKCWTNAEGITECGDAVPPEYAQQESRTVNEGGITIETKERAMTQEERAAARSAAEEKERREAEEAKRAREQAAYDRVLTSTFASVKDIEDSLERKLTAIDDTINLNRIIINKLQEKLAAERRKAANMEMSGRSVSEAVVDAIASYQKQIAEKEQYILSKEAEKEALREEYDAYIQRFKEITGEP